MGKLIILPGNRVNLHSFTPQARKRWGTLHTLDRSELVRHAWCISCNEITSMIEVHGKIENRHLILSGKCSLCGSPVIRLAEN
ncbi:MAG: hypothetical protein GY868_08765 [Deltaproteobacteria bacterium]|nr:hypothetical protein [Deltaproteobacteria bacterium]